MILSTSRFGRRLRRVMPRADIAGYRLQALRRVESRRSSEQKSHDRPPLLNYVGCLGEQNYQSTQSERPLSLEIDDKLAIARLKIGNLNGSQSAAAIFDFPCSVSDHEFVGDTAYVHLEIETLHWRAREMPKPNRPTWLPGGRTRRPRADGFRR